MEVICIDQVRQFEDLKQVREDMYPNDPNANVFMSWARLRGWLEVTSADWVILALRRNEASAYIAFLLLCRGAEKKNQFFHFRDLHIGAKLSAESVTIAAGNFEILRQGLENNDSGKHWVAGI